MIKNITRNHLIRVMLLIVCFPIISLFGCGKDASSFAASQGKESSGSESVRETVVETRRETAAELVCPELENETVLELAEPFSTWLTYNDPGDIVDAGFTDEIKISVIHFNVSHPYESDGYQGDYYLDDAGWLDNGGYYHKWDRANIETLLQKYFGSECRPGDDVYREAGFEVDDTYIMLPAADYYYGGKQFLYKVLNIKELRNGSYEAWVRFYYEDDLLEYTVPFVLQYDDRLNEYYIANIADDDLELDKTSLTFSVKEEDVIKMVEPFHMWTLAAMYNKESISHISDADKIGMSYDLLRGRLYGNGSEGGPGSHFEYDREEAENLMRVYFGKDFSPTKKDYSLAGFGFEADSENVTCAVGDWGMEEPFIEVEDIRRTSDYECEADIQYEDPNRYEDNNGYVYLATWVFALDDVLDLDYIKDVTIEQTDDGSEYMFPFSDKQYIQPSDLEYMSTDDLFIARNEIFARHGRKFKDKLLQEHFDSCSWYHGTIEPEDFDSKVLNKYEKSNVDTILKKEKEKNSPHVPN